MYTWTTFNQNLGYRPHFHIPPPPLSPFAGLEAPEASKYQQLRWRRFISEEEKKQHLCKVDCIVGFTSRLPCVMAAEIASFQDNLLSDATLIKVIQFAKELKDAWLGRNGRGGEGLCFGLKDRNPKKWLRENQHPRLPFSDRDFSKEITNRAFIKLYKQYKLRGNVETQLSTFLYLLLNEF